MRKRVPIEEILRLKSEGMSSRKIAKTLNISRGAVQYNTGEHRRIKHRELGKKRRGDVSNILPQKIRTFSKEPNYSTRKIFQKRSVKRILDQKHFCFFRIKIMGRQISATPKFTVEELKEKIGENPVCYLTGRPIDISKSREYEFDHIIPKSKGRFQ